MWKSGEPMTIEVPGSKNTHSVFLPTHLLLNNATALFVSRRSGGILRFRDARKLKKGIYQLRKELPVWGFVEVTGKNGVKKVTIRL